LFPAFDTLVQFSFLISLSDLVLNCPPVSQAIKFAILSAAASTLYLLIGGKLQEVHWFKQQLASWFIGESVCEGEGNRRIYYYMLMNTFVLELLHDVMIKEALKHSGRTA
jgi:hypothetical protein